MQTRKVEYKLGTAAYVEVKYATSGTLGASGSFDITGLISRIINNCKMDKYMYYYLKKFKKEDTKEWLVEFRRDLL